MKRVKGNRGGTLIQPEKGDVLNPKGKPKGTKNRATLLKKWLEVKAKIKNPETEDIETGTIEDKVALGLILKAINGDVNAYKEIYDTFYGKIPTPVDMKTDQIINLIIPDNVE